MRRSTDLRRGAVASLKATNQDFKSLLSFVATVVHIINATHAGFSLGLLQVINAYRSMTVQNL